MDRESSNFCCILSVYTYSTGLCWQWSIYRRFTYVFALRFTCWASSCSLSSRVWKCF